jgi:hypothetical protein
VRLQVLMAACMKMTAFWDVMPFSLVEVDRRFRLHHRPQAVIFTYYMFKSTILLSVSDNVCLPLYHSLPCLRFFSVMSQIIQLLINVSFHWRFISVTTHSRFSDYFSTKWEWIISTEAYRSMEVYENSTVGINVINENARSCGTTSTFSCLIYMSH